jgi:hypothetical protein
MHPVTGLQTVVVDCGCCLPRQGAESPISAVHLLCSTGSSPICERSMGPTSQTALRSLLPLALLPPTSLVSQTAKHACIVADVTICGTRGVQVSAFSFPPYQPISCRYHAPLPDRHRRAAILEGFRQGIEQEEQGPVEALQGMHLLMNLQMHAIHSPCCAAMMSSLESAPSCGDASWLLSHCTGPHHRRGVHDQR